MNPDTQMSCLLALGLAETDGIYFSLTDKGKDEAALIFQGLTSKERSLLIMYIAELALSVGVLQRPPVPVSAKLARIAWAEGS